MPKLKGLTCSVQWADTGTAFLEYGTVYGDGVVETYIVVPDRPQPFTIHLTSHAFIYEGLAAIVFIDGHYQTNRIRVNLLPAKKGVPRERSELDLTIRQKEKSLGDGLYMGRAWRFDDHNIVPSLPPGVTNSHFEELGTIEVIVLRCSSRNIDETNESTDSSAAQSDILDALEKDVTATSTAEDETSEKRTAKVEKANVKVSKEEDEDPLPFGGLFDGPSDYGRAPFPPPEPAFGHWNWTPRPPEYPGQASYGHPNGGPPSIDNRAPRSEKRVHFDYSREQGPAADYARYWDGHQKPGPYPRAPPYSDDRYYTPGLSEWYRNDPSQYTQGPRHGSAPYGYDMQGGNYRANRDHHNEPLQHEYSPYQYGAHNGVPPPSPGAYPRWAGAPPATHWPTYPTQGVPQVGPPRYYHPQAPPYQPYAGMPYPNPAWANPHGGQNAQGQCQDSFQKPGSLDPAKDENNANDTNQPGNGGVQDQWDDDNKNNSSGGNDDKWGTNNGNQTGDGWADTTTANNNETTNDNVPNDDTGSHKSEDWSGSNKGDQGGAPAWDSNNNDQNNNTQSSWDNSNNTAQNDWNNINNNTTNTTSGGDSWADDTRKASATFSQTSGSGMRPLYGPHGAYYAMQYSTAPAPDVPCDAEEEPRYDVPQSFVNANGSSKQVQPGKGYLYYKKRTHPEYVDQLKEPYARFVFTYMMKHQVEKALSINIDTTPSGNPEVQTLQNMPKDELIKMVIRAKGALGREIPSSPPKSTDADDDAPIKGVPISPPKQDFLTYEMPDFRGGNGSGGAQEGAAAGNANNSTNNAGAGWDADPKQQFSQDSWDQAKEQQKSGPPPAPPPRPETQSNNAGTTGGWDAPPSNAAEANAPATKW